jgi:hypothetical protein
MAWRRWPSRAGRRRDHGGKGDNVTISKKGNSAAYLIAKLKRDHPDIRWPAP